MVFYGDNCYQRYYELWRLASELFGLVCEWVTTVSWVYDEMGDEASAASRAREPPAWLHVHTRTGDAASSLGGCS